MPKIFDRTDEQLGQKVIRINEDFWFEIQQNLLLQIANTNEGRDLLCIPKSYGKIFKIGKNHVFHSPRMEGKEFKYDWDFRIGAKWANVIRYRWAEFQNMARYFQSPAHMKPVVLVGTRTWAFGGPYYPDPDPETTSVDGTSATQSAVWATARAALVGSLGGEDTGVDSNVLVRTPAADLATDYFIGRGFILFDTSAIGDTDTIATTTLSLFGTSTVNNNNTTNVDIVSSTPASNTAIVNLDFDQVGSTVFADKALSAWSTSAYNDFTLDANGIANISKTGVSKFGTRNSRDTDDVAPTGANNVVHIMADTAGTSTDPKLTGTVAGAATASIATTSLLMGVGN